MFKNMILINPFVLLLVVSIDQQAASGTHDASLGNSSHPFDNFFKATTAAATDEQVYDRVVPGFMTPRYSVTREALPWPPTPPLPLGEAAGVRVLPVGLNASFSPRLRVR